jgi:phage gp37-like protein
VSLVIGDVEDEIVRRLREQFAGRVRAVEHKPARLDADELARVLTLAPAAFVSWLGFAAEERLPDGVVRAQWGVYLLAANAAGEVARRRGQGAEIGGYEMAIAAYAALHLWRPASAAMHIEVSSCENLFSAAFEKAGRSCWALALTVPVELPLGVEAVEGALGRFETFDASWDVPPLGDVSRPPPSANRNAGDRVTLPQ